MPPARADATALAVNGLEVFFPTRAGRIRAVAGISYAIAPGRTLGIVGESGSGKSVTALAVMGLLPPPGHIAQGRIALDGQRIDPADDRAMTQVRGARISMIFQEPMTALNPVMTIGAQIAEAWALHHRGTRAEARDAALGMLARVGIPEPGRRYAAWPHEMSGGMRQRAMIAMALACRPQVLIADEPTTALDVTIQAQIVDLIAEMQEEFGMAVQFISHNLGVVSDIADEVAVMYAGRIVEYAATAELFASPRHPYTRALIDTVPRIGARTDRLPAIRGTVPHPLALPPGCAFADRCPLATAECRAAEPALADRGGGHLAACIHSDRVT